MNPSNRHNADHPFWVGVFANFHDRKYKQEPPNYYDFRVALEAIRIRSGMELEQIAVRVGIILSALATHDNKNGSAIRPELYARFKAVALDYDLPRLAHWFGVQESRSRLKKWRRGKEIAGRPDRDYGG